MRFRPYPLLTLFSCLSLAVLIWLGNWQYGRFQEKMALDGQVPDWTVLFGRVVPGSEAVIYAHVPGASAWRKILAVDTGTQIVFTTVELVYQVDPPVPCQGEACGAGLKFSAEGLYRAAPSETVFTPQDPDQAGVFYVFRPEILSETSSLAETGKPVLDELFEPRTILLTEAGHSVQGNNPLAKLRMDDELPPQRHFGYAITWWGLAFALLGVYLAFHHHNGRLRFRAEADT